MNLDENKLAEKILQLLYAVAESSEFINANTFKRYVYLYYLTASFLNGDEDEIDISIDKGDINIIHYDDILSDLKIREFISVDSNTIYISDRLKEYVSSLIENPSGKFKEDYKEIRPFINLLQTYNDQLIFTIFFSEPTFKSAAERGLKEIRSSKSRISELLVEFQKRISKKNIDEYDILTYWMDFILKNYYNVETGESDADTR